MSRLLSSLAVALAVLVTLSLAPAEVMARQAGAPTLTMTTVDPTGYPQVRLRVLAQEPDGRFITDPSARFKVVETGRSAVTAEVTRAPSLERLVVILNVSDALTRDQVEQLSAANDRFFMQLFTQPADTPPVAFDVTVVVPGDGKVPLQEKPGVDSIDVFNRDVRDGIASQPSRPRERTALLDSIELSLQREPEAVVVLSAGQSQPAEQAAIDAVVARARDGRRPVAIHWIDPRQPDQRPAGDLGSIAAATRGQLLTGLDTLAIDALVASLRAQAGPPDYELQFEASQAVGPGPVIFTLEASLPGERSAQTTGTYRPLEPLWRDLPAQLTLIAASGYPTVTVELDLQDSAFRRPILGSTATLRLSGRPGAPELLQGTVQVLPPDPATGESVALVLDPTVAELDAWVEQLMSALSGRGAPGAVSRLAVFLPGALKGAEQWESFTLDYGALRNQTTLDDAALSEAQTHGGMEEPLLRAIDAVDADADARTHPAHVLLLTAHELDDGAYLRLANEARQRGVAIHVVSLAGREPQPLRQLAVATRGVFVDASAGEEFGEIAEAIIAARPTRVRIEGVAKDPADSLTLVVSLDGYERLGTTLLAAVVDEPSVDRAFRWFRVILVILAFTSVTWLVLAVAHHAESRVKRKELVPDLKPEGDVGEQSTGQESTGQAQVSAPADARQAARTRCLADMARRGRALAAAHRHSVGQPTEVDG